MNWSFQEHPPSNHLRNVIKNFWTFEYSGDELRSDYFLPSGMAYLFFMKTDEEFQSTFLESKGNSLIGDGLYAGYINSKVEFAHKKINVVGIALYPVYLEVFCKDGARRFMNEFAKIDECDVFSLDKLSRMPLSEIIVALEHFVAQNLEENSINSEVLETYKKVKETKEYKASIEELSSYTRYSTRQLNNLFKKHLGIPPKRFVQFVRFNHGLELMDQGNTLSKVAQELGYHDQAHFIKDFKRISGMTPKQIVEDRDTISRNFRMF